jgi:hypothetical protein
MGERGYDGINWSISKNAENENLISLFMTTHVGKIGRLSKDCREELGRRIEDGHSGRELVDWLNGLPDVQAVLREKFGGRDINETNLSAWRQSGHLNWLRRQEARGCLRELIEDSNRLDDAAGDWMMGDRLGAVVAAEMNGLAMALLSQEPDLTKRWKYFCEIHREVSRLRQDDDRAQRMVLQKERWDQELAKRGIELERVNRCVDPPTPGFGAASPVALDSGAAREGCEDEGNEGEVAEMAANLENSRQIKEDQGEEENRNPNPEIRENSEGRNPNQQPCASPDSNGGMPLEPAGGEAVEAKARTQEERLWCEEPGYEILHTRDQEHGTRYRKVPVGWQDPEKNEVQSLGTGGGKGRGINGRGIENEAEARPAVPVNSQAGESALLPKAARVPDPDPETEAYIRWWQMHRGFEPFDYEELQRLYAAIPKEEVSSQEPEAGMNGEEVNAEAQRGEGAGELTAESAENAKI